MRVLERRLRRLEVGLLPPAETEESRRLHEIVLDIRRRRAERLGLPVEEDAPDPAYRPGMSLADIIRASRQRRAPAEAARTLVDADGRARP
jgi:hypothetical protein